MGVVFAAAVLGSPFDLQEATTVVIHHALAGARQSGVVGIRCCVVVVVGIDGTGGVAVVAHVVPGVGIVL